MPDLALRRRIAELRGCPNVTTGTAFPGCGCNPESSRPPHGASEAYGLFPAWDCDPDAALDLWAEVVADSPQRVILQEDPHPLGPQIVAVSTYIGAVAITHEDCPDPKERLCRAISLLWLKWKEAA